MRAAAKSEGIGVPAVAVVSSGFEAMARAVASVFGDTDPRLAIYPGAISTDTQAVFEAKVRDTVTGQIRDQFAKDSAQGEYVDVSAAPGVGDVVFSGTLDE